MIARALKTGDTIGVISPSRLISPDLEVQFENGLVFLESLGFKIRLGDFIFQEKKGSFFNPQKKVDDLHAMFMDDEVSAVMYSQGGNESNLLLPLIDWDIIRSNPKIFLGISDATVLLNSVYRKTGLVTFHGNDVAWGFGRNPSEYDRDEFMDILVRKKTEIPASARERVTVRPGRAEGILVGGNLRCLLKLAGTEYFPDMTNSILFLEDISDSMENIVSLLHHLAQIGVFRMISGLILGHFDGNDSQKNRWLFLLSTVIGLTVENPIPVLKIHDFGHNINNTVLPVGGRVALDATTKTIFLGEGFLK